MTALHAAGVVGNDPGNQLGSVGSTPTRRSLRVIPCRQAEANDFIERVHRHHGPRWDAQFYLAVVDADVRVRGVACVGVPSGANLMGRGGNGLSGRYVLEVTRVATDGCPNACSALYGAAARVAKALGYVRIVTYVLDCETGISLRAAGWTQDPGQYGGVSWKNRPGRRDAHPIGPKGRWGRDLWKPLPADPIWPERLDLGRQLEIGAVEHG